MLGFFSGIKIQELTPMIDLLGFFSGIKIQELTPMIGIKIQELTPMIDPDELTPMKS